MNEKMKEAWGWFVGYRDGWESEFDAWLQQVEYDAYDAGYSEGYGIGYDAGLDD